MAVVSAAMVIGLLNALGLVNIWLVRVMLVIALLVDIWRFMHKD